MRPPDSKIDINGNVPALGEAFGLRCLFIDFNAYFASVEQHDNPALRGHPVIVTPLKSEHSGAIAASYEAKALGISRGTTVLEARKLCPDIAVLPARHDRYVAVHHQLMHEIERHLPIERICSIDECVCYLNPDERNDPERGKALARQIKQGLAERVGPALRCSIGLASSSLLAKLAAEMHKPDGLTIIDTQTLPGSLADLPLRAIPGIGGGVEARLARAGITGFLGLWALAPKQARAIWGSVQGERFLYALKGHDMPEPGTPEKRMIGHSRVLSGMHRQPEGARIVARALLLKAASRLRHCGLYAGAMTLSVKCADDRRFSQEARFRATQNSWRFLSELTILWDHMVRTSKRRLERSGYGYLGFKQATIYLHMLRDTQPDRDLFVAAEHDRTDGIEAALWERIDALNRRYGKPQVILASQCGLDLNYLGVKIAFSRVPDAAEFADVGGLEHLLGDNAVHNHESRKQNPARALY